MVKIKLTVLLSLLCFNYDLVRCETTENFVNFCVTNGSKIQFGVENTLKNVSCTCNHCIKRYGLVRYFKINSSEYGRFIRIAKSTFNNSSIPISGNEMSTMKSFKYCSINMTYLCFKMIDPDPKAKIAKINESRYSVNSFELPHSSARFRNDPRLCYTPKRPYSISMVNSTGNIINLTLFCSSLLSTWHYIFTTLCFFNRTFAVITAPEQYFILLVFFVA